MERIKREDKKMGNFGKKAGRITKAASFFKKLFLLTEMPSAV